MASTIIGIFAILIAAAAGFFGYLNHKQYQMENVLKSRAYENKALTETRIKEAEEKISQKELTLKETEELRDKTQNEVTEIQAKTAEKLEENESVKKQVEDLKGQLAKLNEDIQKFGEIQDLITKVNEMKVEEENSLQEVRSLEAQEAALKQQRENAQQNLKAIRTVELRQARLAVSPDFSARVTRAFPERGFVVIGKGDNQGLYTNVVLNVRRGGSYVGKVKVSGVEPNSAVGDVIKGSMAPGDFVQPGDILVADENAAKIDAEIRQIIESGSADLSQPISAESDQLGLPGAFDGQDGADPFSLPGAPVDEAAPEPAAEPAADDQPMNDPFGEIPATEN